MSLETLGNYTAYISDEYRKCIIVLLFGITANKTFEEHQQFAKKFFLKCAFENTLKMS